MLLLTAVAAAVVAVVIHVAWKVVYKVEDQLVAIIVNQVGYFLNYLVHIGREVSYLFIYKSNCDKLKAQLTNLEAARARVQERVDEAKKNPNDIKADDESWLTEVNGKISAVNQLVEDEEKAKQRCLFGLCPDVMSRYKFNKKVEEEANSIAKLLEREGMARLKGYEEFESRRGVFDGVMEALKDANLSIIGVYGMGGVGKTTLVKHVAIQAKENKLFDYVVMAAVTQTPNMLNVQKEIAEKLGMKKFDVDSIDVRAGLLCKRLKEEKSVLIILDDIWSSLNLDELGVPSGDQHRGCKILMTSRDFEVLSQMNSQKRIPIDVLKDDEAWKLFKTEVGVIVESSEILPIATEMAKECAGLPIAIATIGRALKDKNLTHWKNTLRELKRPSISNFKGIPGEVYKCIELSYGFLKIRPELQSTFLLCSILGHNALVEDLVRYCKSLGLIHGVETIEEARDAVSTWIDELKASCLLLDASTSDRVDIHDVVRDVAISIALRDKHWLALGRDDVSPGWSNEETMQNYDLISLQQYGKVGELTELDHELKCPKLTFFFMGGTGDSSLEIPDNFFMGMPKVKVLVLAEMHFSSLPSSIEFLKPLCTLCLRRCVLKNMAIIGELKNLEILDLSYTAEVEELSSEIGKLRRLKLLDLTGCYCLEVIPPNVLSRLSRLEELYLDGSFNSWEVVDEGRGSPVGSNASIVELNNLSHLTILEVHVRNVKAIPEDTTFFGKLERYNISIGREYWKNSEYKKETSRILKLSDRGDKMLDDRLLTKVENLRIDEMNDVTDLERISYSELNVESFSQLRFLQISNCDRLENLFSFSIAKEFHQLKEIDVSNCDNITELIAEKGEEETLKFDKLYSLKLKGLPKLICLCGVTKNISSSQQGGDQSINLESNAPNLFDHKVALPMLEVLEITTMENLESLWPNQLANEESFPKLTRLRLERCYELLNVFPLSMSRTLQRLEELRIEDCKLVEESFGLPLSLGFTNLEKVRITWKDGIKEISNANGLDPQVLASKHFCSLKVVRIEAFPKEMDIFPSMLLQFLISLPNLQQLEMNYAYFKQILEEVQEPMHLSKEKEGLFQNLKNLQVRCCPNLKDNLVPSSLSFQNLVDLEVESCGGIIKLVTHSTAKSLVQLQRMRIKSCFKIEEIIEGNKNDDEDGEVKDELLHFPRLKLLELIDLPNLESFCSSRNYTFQFPSLQVVVVEQCPSLKIFSQEDSYTPMLHKVQISTEPSADDKWSGNLNITIKEMSEEKKSKEDEHNPFTLEQLSLTWNSKVNEIWHSPYHPLQLLPSQYFYTLKYVIVGSFRERIPSASHHQIFQFLISLPNLQLLYMVRADFKEIFQNSSTALEDDKVQILSFQNLVALKIESCGEIRKLVTHSIAKSLVQLQEMIIESCFKIEEIIEGSKDDEEDGEVKAELLNFRQLKLLELNDLPFLKSFCSSANYTFQFPSLQTVIVKQCPSIKKFSWGDSYTPMLHKVSEYESDNEGRWSGSLNSTIQEMFAERSPFGDEDDEHVEVDEDDEDDEASEVSD